MPIHRHKETSETCVCVRGHFEEYLYGYTETRSDGTPDPNSFGIVETVDMYPGGPILNIEKGQWHSLKCLESGTVVFEECGAMIMEEGRRLAVQVRTPWNSNKCHGNNDANYLFYRSVARRTFFEYLIDDETKLKDIVKDYDGEELVEDVAEKLNGIIVIDMAAEDGKVICHSFGNPNSAVWDKMDEVTLHDVVNNGNLNGIYETFEHDNY